MSTKIFQIILISSLVRSFLIIFMSCGVGFVSFEMFDIAEVPEKYRMTLATMATLLMFYAGQFELLKTFFKKSKIKIFWLIVVFVPIPIIYFSATTILTLLFTMFVTCTITSYQSRFVVWKNKVLKNAMIGKPR